jgi:sodium/bile acid cotransporter 7
MRDFLVRRWFLLALVAGLTVAYARPGWLRPGVERLPLRVVVGLALFLMAWGLESRSLYRALVRPTAALWALAVSYGALPLLAWLASGLLPQPDLVLGLLVCASVPCTLASAVIWTRLGGGNEAVALLVVVLSSGLSWLVTPLWLALTTGSRATPDVGEMMGSLVLVLVLPVALGQVSRAIPAVARAVTRHKGLTGTVSRLLIYAIILRAAVDVFGRAGVLSAGALLTTGAVCMGVHLTALCLGLWGGRALGLPRPDAIAVAFSGSQKTLPVGLYLFNAYYATEYPLAVIPIAIYHVSQLVLDTFVADNLAVARVGARKVQG